MKILKRIKNVFLFVYHAIRLLLIPSKSLYSLIFLGNKLSDSTVAKMAIDKLMEREDIQEQYAARYGFYMLDLERLADMPNGSFGKEVYIYFKAQALTVYPLDSSYDPSPMEYLRERRRKIHDFLHVLLEYGIDPKGECEVNAFTCRQVGMPFNFLIIMGLLIRTLVKEPRAFHGFIEAIIKAWNKGGVCENMFVYPWEDLLERPIEEVRMGFLDKPYHTTHPKTITL